MEEFSFFSTSPLAVMATMVKMALKRYLFTRLPHYEHHGVGVPDGQEDKGTCVWITEWEIETLAAWILEHSEDNNVPPELCPLISELLELNDPGKSAYLQHLGPHGDPNMN